MAGCERCGKDVEDRKLKEVFWEEGDHKERKQAMICRTCLDELMSGADHVKGVAGDRKRAAVRIVGGGGAGGHDSIGERGA